MLSLKLKIKKQRKYKEHLKDINLKQLLLLI